jgi:hypothetical protein
VPGTVALNQLEHVLPAFLVAVHVQLHGMQSSAGATGCRAANQGPAKQCWCCCEPNQVMSTTA